MYKYTPISINKSYNNLQTYQVGWITLVYSSKNKQNKHFIK